MLLAATLLTLPDLCARTPDTGVTTLKAASLDELQRHLLEQKPDLDRFRLRGPFAVTVQKNYVVRLSTTERIEADLYLSAAAGKAALVILLHGHDSSKEDHAYQALHLATWGMHSLSVRLPNKGPWIRNGKTLAKIANFIHRRPETVDSRIDAHKIVLVGHSYGGSAVAIALAEGALAVGGILLDPAGVGKILPAYLVKIIAPVIVLASDRNVTPAPDRDYFYEYIRREIIEVSITGAHHEDAQFPLELAPQGIGTVSYTTEELQITFASALTAAAFSLGFTGRLDYAWTSFGDAIQNRKVFDALRK